MSWINEVGAEIFCHVFRHPKLTVLIVLFSKNKTTLFMKSDFLCYGRMLVLLFYRSLSRCFLSYFRSNSVKVCPPFLFILFSEWSEIIVSARQRSPSPITSDSFSPRETVAVKIRQCCRANCPWESD